MFILPPCEMYCVLALYLTTRVQKMMRQLGLQDSWRAGQGDLSSRLTRYSSSSYRSIIPSGDGWLRSISMWQLRPTTYPSSVTGEAGVWKILPPTLNLQAICKSSVQCAIEPFLLHTQPNVSCWHKQPAASFNKKDAAFGKLIICSVASSTN